MKPLIRNLATALVGVLAAGLLVALPAPAALAAPAPLDIYPLQSTYPASPDFALSVNGQTVPVQDYAFVHRGDLLFAVQDVDYRARVDQAAATLAMSEAAVAVAQAQVAEQEAQIGVATAQIHEADAGLIEAQLG